MKTVSHLIIITSLLAMVSCGEKKSSAAPVFTTLPEPQKEKTGEPVKIEIETDQGVFKTTLQPMNGAISGRPNGVVTINIKGENFRIEAEVAGAASGVTHFQTIHQGANCPSDEADTNHDGIIDNAEGSAVYGPSLIPVDGNLKTQIEGMHYGPVANEEGYYFYRKNVSLEALMSDITAEDNDVEDSLVKLLPNQKLKLTDRVIVIYGVAENIELPNTVSTVADISKYESIPVACGRLVRME